ncbi:MAG: glycine cleavage system protein H [Candidatus Zixiibacteriota bacterium]
MVALLVVATFIVALIIDALVRRARGKQAEPAKVYSPAVNRPAPGYPRGYFFTPGHVWLNLRSSGKVQVGVDELIGRLIGKVDHVQLKKTGERIRKGDLLASVTLGDKTIRMLSPIEGTIERHNFELEDNPAEFVESPYTKGWFYLINPTNLAADLKGFTVADQTRTWWFKELTRLRVFVQAHLPQPAVAGLTLSDGGLPLDGLVAHFDRKTVEELEIQFLGYKSN